LIIVRLIYIIIVYTHHKSGNCVNST